MLDFPERSNFEWKEEKKVTITIDPFILGVIAGFIGAVVLMIGIGVVFGRKKKDE